MKGIMKIVAGVIISAAALALAPTASATPLYNEATVDKFITVINMEAARYGQGHVPVYVDYLSGNVIAMTQGGAVTLDATYAAMTPEVFDYYMSIDFASGHTPGGCNGIAAVAIHEFAHVIDQRGGSFTRAELTSYVNAGQIGYDMHGYAFNSNGTINPGEAVAVSFQAVECGSATPTETSIYNLLVS
jgi:hypothetical protein